ncbi:MAG: hypothetical protein IJD48_04180 [Clostridia bacterium]|nr:hypothetical protein [Clostridia bacterium]
MEIVFYSYKSFEKLKDDLKKVNCDLFVFCFNKQTPVFLSCKYYKLLTLVKSFSKQNNTDVVFLFYIKKENRNLVNGLYINCGNVNKIFGEVFSKKCLLIKKQNKLIQVMFYYDLYTNRCVYNLNDVDLFIGIENFAVDNVKFLFKKFFNKIVIVDGEQNLFFNKETKNIDKKLCKYYIQN